MNIHVIVDFNYNYHRIKRRVERDVESGKQKTLTAFVNGEEIDTTYIYFTLLEIEAHRKRFLRNKNGSLNTVTMSVCVDSKSGRKEEDADYKANREGKLEINDFENIERAVAMLRVAGYNIYKEESLEADDLVKGLVDRYKDSYDLTAIFTNDADLLVNLEGLKVIVLRYKSNLRAHVVIMESNMPAIMSKEYKCGIYNNTIMLYKALVGDKSDTIKGVKGFGPKAFDKYMQYLFNKGVTEEDLKLLKYPENCEKMLNDSLDYLGEDKLKQALKSLSLVQDKPSHVTDTAPVKSDSIETRLQAYAPYLMKSLIE